VDLLVRPRAGRLRQPTVVVLVIAAIFLFCTAGAAVDHVGTDEPLRPAYLIVALALLLIPLGLIVAFLVLNGRNVFLRWSDGALTLGEWTGRRVTVDQPQSARQYPVGASRLLVVSGREDQPHIVLNPDWWVPEELDRILSAVGRPVSTAPGAAVLPGIRRDHPGTRLPFSVRYPAVFTIGSIVGSLAWLTAMAFLITHL